jgi:hypothetical protein
MIRGALLGAPGPQEAPDAEELIDLPLTLGMEQAEVLG